MDDFFIEHLLFKNIHIAKFEKFVWPLRALEDQKNELWKAAKVVLWTVSGVAASSVLDHAYGITSLLFRVPGAFPAQPL